MNIVIKVGGAFLQRQEDASWIDDLISLHAQGHRVYLVHGAGPFITKAIEESGIKSQFIDGQRVTQKAEMKVVHQVLSHQVNPFIVQKIQAKGAKAIGLSGVDGHILQCDYFNKELGQVGRVVKVNTTLLQQMAEHGIVVLSPVGIKDSTYFNVNADVAACSVAKALPHCSVAFLTGTDGVLDQNGQLLNTISRAEIDHLITDKTIQGGMIVKVKMIQDVLETTLKVGILNATVKNSLRDFISQGTCSGTVFTKG